MTMEHRLLISAENGGRIDSVVAHEIDGLSRSYAQKLIKSGGVTLNGKTAKNSDIAGEGDVVFVCVPEAVSLDVAAEAIPLDIVYEDEELLVVNKPSGMVVHPAAGHSSGTLVNALMAHCEGRLSGINGVMRPGIVHRIDRDTSGLLLVAKTDAAHFSLAEQISERTLVRRYKALVVGNVREAGVVDAAIGRNTKSRKEMAVLVDGKPAVTHYEPIEWYEFRGARYTLVECKLETGRTHQIRVHMRHIGHPVVGDLVYGGVGGVKKELLDVCQGQLLHAYLVGFMHPKNGEHMEFSAELPKEFEMVLGKII